MILIALTFDKCAGVNAILSTYSYTTLEFSETSRFEAKTGTFYVWNMKVETKIPNTEWLYLSFPKITK